MGSLFSGGGGDEISFMGIPVPDPSIERERLTEEFAPGRAAELQTAGLGGASPWFKAEQLARQTEGAGGGSLGSLDDYMATARKFLGVPETGAAASAAPAPGTTATPAGEAALTAARGPSAVSGISVASELGEFPEELGV